jgi:hypothetical protein
LYLLLDRIHSLCHMRHMSNHLLCEGLEPFGWTAASLTVDILTVCLHLVVHCDIRRRRSYRCVTFVRSVRTVETDDALDAASAWMQRSLGPMKSDETTALVAARLMLSLRG